MIGINGKIWIGKPIAAETTDKEPVTDGAACPEVNVSVEMDTIPTTTTEATNCELGGSDPTLEDPDAEKVGKRSIKILRRVTLFIIFIDGILSFAESRLASAGFLLLTLSTTFDIRPENVIDTYCYSEGTGSGMCEDYLERITGFATTPLHFTSTDRLADALTEDETYQLFLMFNQTLFEDPARYSLGYNFNKGSNLAKATSQNICEQIHKTNGSGSQNGTHQSGSACNTRIENQLEQSLNILASDTPFMNVYIPQVIQIMHRMESKLKEAVAKMKDSDTIGKDHDKTKGYDTPSNEGSTSLVQNVSILQAKQILQHRWKRSVNMSTTTTRDQTSISEKKSHVSFIGIPDYSNSTKNAEKKTAAIASTTRASLTMGQLYHDVVDSAGNIYRKYNRSDPSLPSYASTLTTANISGGIQERHEVFAREVEGNMRNTLMNGKRKVARETPETPFITAKGSKEMHNDHTTLIHAIESPESLVTSGSKKGSENIDGDVKQVGKQIKSRQEKQKHANIQSELDAILAEAEANFNDLLKVVNGNMKPKSARPAPSSTMGKRKNHRNSTKGVHDLLLKMERSPRNFMTLMEASLYRKWKVMLDVVKHLPIRNTACSDCTSEELNIRMESILQDLTLTLKMDIFNPDTYKKGERRKRALEQIYHDYSSTIMKKLGDYKDMPISNSFKYIHTFIRIYVLVWELLLCALLFYGAVYEDQTALNVWGIFNILTTFVHFMTDEWINTNFHPHKTSATIWFSILYSTYKPFCILLVSSLSSELMQTQRYKRKSFYARLYELIMGKKQKPKCVIRIARGVAPGNDDGKNGGKGISKITLTKLRMKPINIEDLKIFTNGTNPLITIGRTDKCHMCGANATASGLNNSGADSGIGEEPGVNDSDNIVTKVGIFCPCSTPQQLTQDDLFDYTDDDDGDYTEAGIPDDEDEDDEEDDDEQTDRNGRAAGKKEQVPVLFKSNTAADKGLKKEPALVVILSEGKQTNFSKKNNRDDEKKATKGNKEKDTGRKDGERGFLSLVVDGGNIHM